MTSVMYRKKASFAMVCLLASQTLFVMAENPPPDSENSWPAIEAPRKSYIDRTCNPAGFCVKQQQGVCYQGDNGGEQCGTPRKMTGFKLIRQRKIGVCQKNFEPAVNEGCEEYSAFDFSCAYWAYYDTVVIDKGVKTCMNEVCKKFKEASFDACIPGVKILQGDIATSVGKIALADFAP